VRTGKDPWETLKVTEKSDRLSAKKTGRLLAILQKTLQVRAEFTVEAKAAFTHSRQFGAADPASGQQARYCQRFSVIASPVSFKTDS